MPTPKMSYRWCYVPNCGNTTRKTPGKLFFCVPLEERMKKKWFGVARRKYIPTKTRLFCCEDHFILKHDMENYLKYSLTGTAKKLKKDVLPHIFNCQNNRKVTENLCSPLKKRSCQTQVMETIKESTATYSGSSNSEEIGENESLNVIENGQNEKQSDAVAKTNERKRSCSTESTTEGSESNNFTLERRGTAELGTKNGKEFNSESLNADPDDQPFTLRGYKRRRRNLMKWSDEEKQVTEKFFRRHINLRISPKKREVLQLIKLHPKLFKDRKWDVIKVYVCNKYNSKSKSMALSPVQTDSIDLESDGMSCDSARRKEIDCIYPFLLSDIKEEPSLIDPLFGENISEEDNEKETLKNNTRYKKDEAEKVTVCPVTVDKQSTLIKKEQTSSAKMYSGKIMSNQKPPTLLDSKVIPANGKYLAVLKQLPQSGEASQEKKSFQNLQTTTTSSGDNIVLKRLVFDTEKRCFRAVDSNELVNAMSKKIRVLSVNHEGIDGMSSLNVLQKVPPLLLDGTECPEKESSFMEGIVPVSTDDMCILCARKMSPTHNISHLVNLIRDIAGVNLSNLNLPLRACEECVADVNVTLRLRNTIKRAYEDLVKKDDTFTMNVLPPKTAGQHGKSPVNETDTIASKEASTTVTEKSSVTHQENMNTDDSEIMQKLNEHNPDGFKQIKLLKGDDCGRKISSGDNYSKYHMNSETEKICEQLCITNSSQKEHLRECKKADVICKVCNRSFRTLQNLRWHMRCHVYKCEVCCKTFLYGIAKKNHLKEEHTEQEVQKSLENMKTDKEKSKFVPYCSRQTVILKTMKEEKEQIEVKEETENIINGIKQEEVIL